MYLDNELLLLTSANSSLPETGAITRGPLIFTLVILIIRIMMKSGVMTGTGRVIALLLPPAGLDDIGPDGAGDEQTVSRLSCWACLLLFMLLLLHVSMNCIRHFGGSGF